MTTYPLDEVLLAMLVGVVCGADDWEGVEAVAEGAWTGFGASCRSPRAFRRRKRFAKCFVLLISERSRRASRPGRPRCAASSVRSWPLMARLCADRRRRGTERARCIWFRPMPREPGSCSRNARWTANPTRSRRSRNSWTCSISRARSSRSTPWERKRRSPRASPTRRRRLRARPQGQSVRRA